MTWNSEHFKGRWEELENFYQLKDFYQLTNKKMPNKLLFLTSSRFWAIVIAAVSIYLKMKGVIGESEMTLIATIAAGFTIVKTVDKNVGEAGISAAQITAGAPVVTPKNNSSTM